MESKQYVLTILDALLDIRPLAKSLKVLVSTGAFWEETINALLEIFKESIKEVSDEKQRKKLKKSLSIINKIKNIESQERKHIEAELGSLINNI